MRDYSYDVTIRAYYLLPSLRDNDLNICMAVVYTLSR